MAFSESSKQLKEAIHTPQFVQLPACSLLCNYIAIKGAIYNFVIVYFSSYSHVIVRLVKNYFSIIRFSSKLINTDGKIWL